MSKGMEMLNDRIATIEQVLELHEKNGNLTAGVFRYRMGELSGFIHGLFMCDMLSDDEYINQSTVIEHEFNQRMIIKYHEYL